jgi:hypothetical protein
MTKRIDLFNGDQAAEPRAVVSALKHLQITETFEELSARLSLEQRVANEYAKFLQPSVKHSSADTLAC